MEAGEHRELARAVALELAKKDCQFVLVVYRAREGNEPEAHCYANAEPDDQKTVLREILSRLETADILEDFEREKLDVGTTPQHEHVARKERALILRRGYSSDETREIVWRHFVQSPADEKQRRLRAARSRP